MNLPETEEERVARERLELYRVLANEHYEGDFSRVEKIIESAREVMDMFRQYEWPVHPKGHKVVSVVLWDKEKKWVLNGHDFTEYHGSVLLNEDGQERVEKLAELLGIPHQQEKQEEKEKK